MWGWRGVVGGVVGMFRHSHSACRVSPYGEGAGVVEEERNGVVGMFMHHIWVVE